MVMMEVPEPEVPSRPLRPPTFSAPFAAPSLRWPAKKRLRGFSPDASSSLHYSPSRSPLHRLSPPLDAAAAPGKCAATSAEQPPPPSDRPRVLIRLRKARREGSPRDDEGEPPPPSPAPPSKPSTDLSSAALAEVGRGGEGEGGGRTLRSSSRLAGEEEEKVGKRKGRVELWVPLSRTEVEEDFLRMTGSKPPRRCRLRRRRAGPDLLSVVFPGSWLPNRITADRYKVAEPSNPKEV